MKKWAAGPWLLTGDFNLIYKAADKNNNRLDRRLMSKFRETIEELELKELALHRRKYTWTNGQAQPTMTRIDRCFSTTTWEEKFPTCNLQALVSTLSDHCPLYLQGVTQADRAKGFKFENFWIHMPGFQEIVQQTWKKPVATTNAFRKLHTKLGRLAKALKLWQKNNVGTIKKQIVVAKEIIWLFDVTQER